MVNIYYSEGGGIYYSSNCPNYCDRFPTREIRVIFYVFLAKTFL